MGTDRPNRLLSVALVGVLVTMAGCASKRPEQSAQTDAIDTASRRISEAERGGAYQYNSEALTRARDKLKAAQQAAEEDDNQKAQWLAEEAALDADLASATASNQEIQTALGEVQESVKTLQEELRRNEQRQQSQLSADGPGGTTQGQGQGRAQ